MPEPAIVLAPVLALGSSNGPKIIVILVFIIMIGHLGV